MKVLVAGAGSIGRRHTRNLCALGIQHVAVCDPDPERLEAVVAEMGVRSFVNFEQALTETSIYLQY